MSELARADGSRLLDLQRKFRELGRLRMGKLSKPAKGKPRPIKLSNWRLTSSSETLLLRAAEAFGGSVQVWADAPTEGANFELITETNTLPIRVPPGEVLTQWYELWSGGGCQRRCGGPNPEGTSRRADRDVRCACPFDLDERKALAAQGKACHPTTRLSVMLPDLPDVGVWRLESHGYFAAEELAGTYDLLKEAAGRNVLIEARLTIQHRTSKGGGEKKNYVVPVIEIDERFDDIALAFQNRGHTALEAATPVERKALATGTAPAVVSDEAPETPAPGEIEGATFGDTGLGDVVDAEIVEPDLPAWILELPGFDDDICRAAERAAEKAGRPQEIRSLKHLATLEISVQGQKAIRAELAAAGIE